MRTPPWDTLYFPLGSLLQTLSFKTQNTAGLNYWLMEDLFMMELELYFIFFLQSLVLFLSISSLV